MFVTLKKEFLSQPAGKVIDVTDADGKALLDSGIAEVSSGDPLGGIIAKSFDALSGNLTKSLDSLFQVALKQFQEAQEHARKISTPAIFGDDNQGDPKHNFADWLAGAPKVGSSSYPYR